MAILYTNSGSFNNLQVTGSTVMSASSGVVLQLKGSGSTIFSISGSAGEIFNISDKSLGSSTLFSVASGNTTILNVDDAKNVNVSGSLLVTGSTYINGLVTSSTAITNVIMQGANGQLFVTSSSAIRGGSGTPGGSNKNIQYNNNGVFGGSSNFNYNYISQSLEQGTLVTASGLFSHAEGFNTYALYSSSHAEGFFAVAGYRSSYIDDVSISTSTPGASSRIGFNTFGYGPAASTIAFYLTSSLPIIVLDDVFGYTGTYLAISSSYSNETVEVDTTIPLGTYIGFLVFGLSEIIGAHAEGNNTYASNYYSHTEGVGSIAYGEGSHAEGLYCEAFYNYSHAEGNATQTKGLHAHAEGQGTITLGEASHAEGYLTTTYNRWSHAEGIGTITRADGQLAVGKYNTDSNTTSLFVIGNGTSNNNRSNLALFNSQSIILSSSVSIQDVLILPFQNPLPSNKPTGSIALSGSGGTLNGMYVYNGTSWINVKT